MVCSPEILGCLGNPENVFWHLWKHTRCQIYCVIWQQTSDKISTICIKLSHLCRQLLPISMSVEIESRNCVLCTWKICYEYFQKRPFDWSLSKSDGKWPVMQETPWSASPARRTVKIQLSRLMWRVASHFIGHVSFDNTLCYTEPRILPS